MSFNPAPRAEDVELPDCCYPRREIVAARKMLLDIVQAERTGPWHRIKQKLGILPDGRRIRTSDEPEQLWIPNPLPEIWSAPVCLRNPQTTPALSGVKAVSEPSQKRAQEEAGSEKGQSQKKIKVGQVNSASEANGSAVLKPSGERIQWGSPAIRGASNSSTTSSFISQGTNIKGSPDADSSSSSNCCALDSVLADSLKGNDTDDVVIISVKLPKSEPTSDEIIHISDSPVKRSSSGVQAQHDCSESNLRSGSNPSTKSHVQGEGTSGTRQMEPESSSVGGQRSQPAYRMMFRCDLCPYLCEHRESMVEHLQKPPGHYTASRYLGLINPLTGDLVPKLLSAVSVVQCKSQAFKNKIPACPFCPMLFVDVGQCVDHCAQVHQASGLYAMRVILSSHKLKFQRASDKCLSCKQRFPGTDLKEHIVETQHMADYVGDRKSHQRTIVFPCRSCPEYIIHADYFAHKKHCFTHHSHQVTGKKKYFISTCLTLSKQQPPIQLLPREPVVAGWQLSQGDNSRDCNPVLQSLAADAATVVIDDDDDDDDDGNGGGGGHRGRRKRQKKTSKKVGGSSAQAEDMQWNKHSASRCWTEEKAERKKLVKLERKRRRRAVLKNNKKMLAATRKTACTVTSGAGPSAEPWQ